MKTIINWRVFFTLWIASILATIAILPYVLELQSGVLEQLDLPIPLPALIILQVIQSGLLFAVSIFLGLLLAKRVGLGTPILDSVTRSESVFDKVRAILPISIGLGVLASLLIAGLDVYIFQPALIQELGEKANVLNQTAQPAAWKGFLASFYGGIAEEILLRLFVMSLLAWLGSFIKKTKDGKPTNIIFWIANILAAILFGIGHLPAASLILPLTTLVVIRIVLLNAVGGILFGWLYQKHGLESAMIAHFSADIVLHVLLAL
ncbi:MAG TPA: CPBP family intramembrane glutamic endopeptidase [Anaerolineales bacterium]|nr:CPBP family intramembrane glutamic endopeptidase [Anaerolineales bacterium]